jgi:hypothetical protein
MTKTPVSNLHNGPKNAPTNHSKATYTEWTRLNHKGIYHDNRRLLKHRAKNCECSVCYREIYKLPPMETQQEFIASITKKKEEQTIKKARRAAKKDIKAGKQRTMEGFFQPLG